MNELYIHDRAISCTKKGTGEKNSSNKIKKKKKKQLIIKLISNRGEIWLDIGLFV